MKRDAMRVHWMMFYFSFSESLQWRWTGVKARFAFHPHWSRSSGKRVSIVTSRRRVPLKPGDDSVLHKAHTLGQVHLCRRGDRVRQKESSPCAFGKTSARFKNCGPVGDQAKGFCLRNNLVRRSSSPHIM